MAAPTAPTLATIVSEGLKKAGYSSPHSALTTRAQDYWMEEIKNEIWTESQILRSLKKTWIQATTNGLSKYSLPSDFHSLQALELLHGAHTGTAQAGAAGTITLASDEDADSTWIIGREIVIYSGTGANQISQVTAYDSTTKVASVSPSWTSTPDNTSVYMIIDDYFTLESSQDADFYRLVDPGNKGEPPTNYFLEEDADYGNIIFDSAPYDTSAPYIIRAGYHANLMTLDIASTTMATIYSKWRNLFVQGVYYKALGDMDDNRYWQEYGRYKSIKEDVLRRERLDTGASLPSMLRSCY